MQGPYVAPRAGRRPSGDGGRERHAQGGGAAMHALLQPDLPPPASSAAAAADRPRGVSQLGARRASGERMSVNGFGAALASAAAAAESDARQKPRVPSGGAQRPSHPGYPSSSAAYGSGSYSSNQAPLLSSRVPPFQANGLSQALMQAERRGSQERRAGDHGSLASLLSASPLLPTHAPPPAASAAHMQQTRAAQPPPRDVRQSFSKQHSQYSQQQQQQPHPHDPHQSNGRHTPEPPRGSYRLNPDEVMQPHPPSAPPAPRQPRPPAAPRGPPSAGVMGMHLHSQPYNGGGDHNGPAAPLHSQTPRILFGDGRHAGGDASHHPQHQQAPSHSLLSSREGGRRPPQHPPQSSSAALRPPQPAANNDAVGRGSLSHTILSARSSAFSQLTLQQPFPAPPLGVAAAANPHLNSPSPNSTPVKPNFAARAGLFERERGGGAASGAPLVQQQLANHFDRLHLFAGDSSAHASPLGSPKDSQQSQQQRRSGAPQRAVSVRELGSAMFGQRQPPPQPHMRARSNVPHVAMSWPSELSGAAGAQRQGGAAGAAGGGPGVRASLPLLSPPASMAARGGAVGGQGRNFPTLRGAQLIEEAPPVLSPELAHELQLDDFADVHDISFGDEEGNDDYGYDEDGDSRPRKLAPPDFSAAAHALDGHDSASATAAPAARGGGGGGGGNKPARVGSGSTSRSAKKSAASSTTGGGGGPPAGIKKLDLATAQTMRSPYARNAFAKQKTKGAAAGAVAPTAGALNVVPAEEWVESSSDSEDAETSSQHPSSHVDFGGLGGGGGGTDEGGGGGGWLLDIGVAEDANPRFRASMEDAHIIRRKFGPPVVATAAAHRTHEHSGEAENKEALAGGGGGGSTLLYGSLFGVFDGHGGRATVDFLERHFPRALSRKLRTLREGCSSSEVSRALESTFLHVDAAMAPQETRERVYGTPFQDCGSTACVAYLRPNAAGTASRELFLANVGDAQAVIAVDKKELQRGNMASGSSGAGGAAAAAAASGTNKKSKRGSNSTANRAVSPTPRADGSSESLAPTERTPKKGGTHKKSASSRGGANNTSSSAKDSPLAKTLARGSSAQLASTARAVKLTAQSLSYAHVASDSKEVARIKAAGGCVFANRVGGCLAVSRAFGDYALKASGVSCVPYQQHVSLTPAHKFLILACDGLFDVMDAQTAVDTVASLRDAQQMADKLVALALKRGTTDNVSCMVVRLHE